MSLNFICRKVVLAALFLFALIHAMPIAAADSGSEIYPPMGYLSGVGWIDRLPYWNTWATTAAGSCEQAKANWVPPAFVQQIGAFCDGPAVNSTVGYCATPAPVPRQCDTPLLLVRLACKTKQSIWPPPPTAVASMPDYTYDVCRCPQGSSPDFESGYCLGNRAQISVTADAEVRPAGIPGHADVKITAKVADGATAKVGVTVTFSVDVAANTGGHDHHDATRPKGKLSVPSGVTDSKGEVTTTFKASQIAGMHTIEANCATCANSPAVHEIRARVPGLVNVFALPFRDAQWAYPGVGQVPGRHSENHYLTVAAATRLLDSTRKFKAIWPDAPRLTLNDASLEWGGKFDIPGTWEGNPNAHAEHRLGDSIDVRANDAPGAVPLAIRAVVFRWLRKQSRVEDNIPPEFVIDSVNPLREAIGHPNEHFHLRLGD